MVYDQVFKRGLQKSIRLLGFRITKISMAKNPLQKLQLIIMHTKFINEKSIMQNFRVSMAIKSLQKLQRI